MTKTSKNLTATNSSGYDAPVGITVDPVIFTVRDQGSLAVLLINRGREPFIGQYALPGGFVGASEDPAETASRKLAEKTGLKTSFLEQLRTYAEPGRDPRGWLPSIAYVALVPEQAKPLDSEAEWLALETVKNAGLAFDHNRIVADALERLQGKLWYSNVAAGLLPKEFTLSEARRVYEAIAQKRYNAPNFARDLKASGLITETGKTRSEGPGRPAKTFRFRHKGLRWGPGYGKGTKRGSSR